MESKAGKPRQTQSRKINQKRFFSDRNLIIFTTCLLAFETVWLLAHLQFLPGIFQNKESQLQQKAAGKIVRKENDLKRRPANSLIWENTENEDLFFYHDSVMTLSQSSATLSFENQSEIHLSENTLVTIEPRTTLAQNEIRIQLKKGDLQAKNTKGKTWIDTPDWTLDLQEGSEVSLRQNGNQNFEVQVTKGQLQLNNGEDKKEMTENQIVQINQNKISELKNLSSQIQFEGPNYQRIYTRNSRPEIPLSWIGQAQKIEVTALSENRTFETKVLNTQSTNLPLPPGRYSFRLIDQQNISQVKEVEIWQAPDLHLLSPGPRARLNTDQEIQLIWSFIPEAKRYRLQLKDQITGKTWAHEVYENSMTFQYAHEANIVWDVVGIDENGFEIPAVEKQNFYLRLEPFAAPRLKRPELRIPASQKNQQKPSSSLLKEPWLYFVWNILMPSAHAQTEENASDDFEAVFQWEKVPGADQYTIEISSDPKFRRTLVSKTVKKTSFVWNQFKLGTYYWRVAAGSSDGRMGIFSEPTQINLNQMQIKSEDSNDQVYLRKKAELERNRPDIKTDDQDILQNAPSPVFDQEIFKKQTVITGLDYRDLKNTYSLNYSPTQSQWSLTDESEIKTELKGLSTQAGHFQTEQVFNENQSWMLDIYFAQNKWKAQDISTLTSQEDQSQTDVRAQILFGNDSSFSLRGLQIQSVPTVNRKQANKIEIQTNWTAGPVLYFIWNDYERFKSHHSIGVLAGNQIFVISNQNHFKYQIFKGENNALSLGLRLQGDGIFFQRTFSTGAGIGLTLGLDSF